jgi:hypothetical protein
MSPVYPANNKNLQKLKMAMEDNFAVILVAGLAVFGLFWVASEGISGSGGDTQEMVYMDENFGTIGESVSDYRPVNFSDFTVGEGRGQVSALQTDSATISNSLTSSDRITVNYNATAPRTGQVSFEVLGKAGTGAVFVKANDDVIFEEKLITTGTPEITIPEENLKPGINEIVIGARQGGLFSSTTYTLEDVQVYVDDRKFSDYRDTFRIFQHEYEDFTSGELSFQIPLGSSTPSSPLEIEVNDREVFSQSVSRSTQNIQINPQNADLTPGLNTIEFSTEGDARYEIENAGINIRYIGQVSQGSAETSFELDTQEKNYADREDTVEYINFNYRTLMPTPRPVNIQVNDYSTQVSPNNFNSLELPEGTLQESNEVSISANGSHQINGFKILSQRVEDGSQ